MRLNFDLLEQKLGQEPQVSMPESGRIYVVSGTNGSNNLLSQGSLTGRGTNGINRNSLLGADRSAG